MPINSPFFKLHKDIINQYNEIKDELENFANDSNYKVEIKNDSDSTVNINYFLISISRVDQIRKDGFYPKVNISFSSLGHITAYTDLTTKELSNFKENFRKDNFPKIYEYITSPFLEPSDKIKDTYKYNKF